MEQLVAMPRPNVESEVTSTFWKVEMSVGDSVAEGDVLMILESMKMEIPVESPVTGTITVLRVAPEDAVEEDQIVAIIES